MYLGSTSDCESILPALVQMKVTMGAMERQMQEMQPPKREWFCMWWPQTNALPLSFLADSSLGWCSTSVLVNNSD